ncbi:MAG TPA: DUF4037 domain-containing protein [Nocardioidaceae bacterium]|nr:DUF4037 domain-containing protein [Nocardioidaceae bacterium]
MGTNAWRSGADAGESPDMAWRMACAHDIARGYTQNSRLTALTVAGSVGAGLADRWSDLELDCYWLQAPTDADRRTPIDRAGAVLAAFWEYDPDDREWSEDYRVGSLPVTVSNFTVESIEEMLAAVVDNADTDPVKHMRLAAVQNCVPLRGADIVELWRSRAAGYPDALVDAMVSRWLAPGILAGWSARDALASRGDEIAIRGMLSRIENALLGALLALNRTYVPHRLAKWQGRLIDRLRLAPDDFAERIDDLWRHSMSHALDGAESLLDDTVDLVAQHTTADLTEFREALADSRRPIDQG